MEALSLSLVIYLSSAKPLLRMKSPEDPYANFPTGMLTEAQAMHYAMGGVPENDPELVGKQ
jgi:hypothetical protein